MKKRILVLAAALMTLAPLSAFAGGRVVMVRPRAFVGSAYVGPYWGSPYWAGPYWGPPPLYYDVNAGTVKIDTKVKDAQVYINGALAGSTHDNRTMQLRPGNYRIEIRYAGETRFDQKVYVVAGKTLHLTPSL